MHSKIHTYPLRILEGHLDTFGHVNNAVYLAICEEARWDLLTKNGYGLEKIMATKIGPTILEIKINFLKELKLRDEIVIETRQSLTTRKSAYSNTASCAVQSFAVPRSWYWRYLT